jgi:hypothetical protein
MKNPLSAAGEERVALEEPRGESTARVYYRQCRVKDGNGYSGGVLWIRPEPNALCAYE